MLELGVGTGRIAVPVAAAGIAVDRGRLSEGMLEVARERAELAGVGARPAPRRHARAAGRGVVPARRDPVPLDAPHGDRRRPPCGPARSRASARAGRPLRLRRLRARRRRHRGHARPVARARAGDLGAGGLGRAHQDARPARPRRGARRRDVARVALRAGVEGASSTRRASWSTRSTGGSTARRGAAARTRSGSAAATRRGRSRPTPRRSATRRRRSGSTPRRPARPRPVDLRAPHRAGTRRDPQVDGRRAARRACASSATRVPSTSSHVPSGTRQIDPALARSAFGEVGSAQPGDSATAAPNASAVRISVPTLPGSESRHSASVAGRSLQPGRSSRR